MQFEAVPYHSPEELVDFLLVIAAALSHKRIDGIALSLEVINQSAIESRLAKFVALPGVILVVTTQVDVHGHQAVRVLWVVVTVGCEHLLEFGIYLEVDGGIVSHADRHEIILQTVFLEDAAMLQSEEIFNERFVTGFEF